MDSVRSFLFFLSLALLSAGPAAADVLLLDSIQSSPAMGTPRAGTSMASVRQQYGTPVAEQPTVSTTGGPLQPPISRWDYDAFSVVFEHDRVVHSVMHRASGN